MRPAKTKIKKFRLDPKYVHHRSEGLTRRQNSGTKMLVIENGIRPDHAQKDNTNMARIQSESLEDLLRDVHSGRIRIPDFQRSLNPQEDWVRSLLASVSLDYPIGAVTLMDDVQERFASHSVPGAPAASWVGPARLLIDGQFRLAALYQALHAQARTPRHYYLDLDAWDREMPRDQVIVSRPGRDAGAGRLFPLRRVFGADTAPHGLPAAVRQAFRDYVVPVILVAPQTAWWTVRVHGGPDGPALSDRYFPDRLVPPRTRTEDAPTRR